MTPTDSSWPSVMRDFSVGTLSTPVGRQVRLV